MRRAPLFSILLWSAAAPAAIVATGCGDKSPGLFDAGVPGTDVMQAGSIAFGDAECGETPPPRTLTFHNTGGATLTWTAAVQGDGFAITAGATGSAAPGEAAAITVAPATIPPTTQVGATISATLVITTNASDAAYQVPLAITAHGGSLAIGGGGGTIGFGQIQLTATADQDVTIENHGDRPLALALAMPADAEFSATWTGAPAPATVDPDGALAGARVHFTPTTAGAKSETIAVEATGPLCAGDVAQIALAGEGTLAQVSITPGTLQFGATACGATAPSQQVTIDNGYGFAITYTAAIGSGPYAIRAGQATGTVPGNGKVKIDVDAAAVPKAAASLGAGALAGTMTITTSAPQSTPASLSMAQVAHGAILAISPAPGATIDFGDVIAGTPESQAFTVANTGDTAAAIAVTVTGSGYKATTPGGGSIPATGAAISGAVTETVAKRGSLPGTLAVTTTTALCQASAPAAVKLAAVGKAPVAAIGAVPAMSADCGAAAPATVDVPVSNTGDAPLTITAASASGGFVVTSAIPMTIAAGASGVVSVRPPLAVVGTDLGGSVKTGTLSLVTNEIATPTRTAALASTVMGANISLVDAAGNPLTSLAFTADAACPAPQEVFVKNTGNVKVHLSPPPGTLFAAGFFSPSSLVDGGGTISDALRPFTSKACTATETISYASSGPRCTAPATLQATFTITGQSSCFCS
jgi:hypothetical protein